MPPSKLTIRRIGIDLDNTAIDYAPSYALLAPSFGVNADHASRYSIRAKLRRGTDDDEEWQRFQSVLYTEGLSFAQPASGLRLFLRICLVSQIEVYIISHKTERGPKRFGGRQLRQPAMTWMTSRQLVPSLIMRNRVLFADSLSEKVELISQCRLDVFVDDLLEVLDHARWPEKTLGLRYVAGGWQFSGNHWSVGFPALAEWIKP